MASYLILYIIAGALLIVEAFSPGVFIFICFALATLLTGVIDHIWGFDSLQMLLLVNLTLSVMALFIVRPALKAWNKVPADLDPRNFGNYSEKLIGRDAMVFKAITSVEPGAVKLFDYDETWLAKSEDGSEIGQGSTVKVEAIEGNHLVVKL